jgi:hypothetical protein
LLDDKKKEMAAKIVNALLSKLHCPSKRRMFSIKKLVKGAGKAIKGAAKKVGKVIHKVADKVGHVASDAFHTAEGFANKYGGTIINVACTIIGDKCGLACEAAVTAVSQVAKSYGIPLACASGAITDACSKGCKSACGKRRLRVRRN